MLLGTTFAHAMAVTPLWMRDVRISPDGKEIVFCYKGDIYKVSAKGGEAVQLTTQDSYESFRMSRLRCGRRTVNRLLLPAIVLEIQMCLLCRLTAVLPVD